MYLDELLAPVRTAIADYSGSLDYIDRLPSKAPISVKLGAVSRWREAVVFSNAYANNVNLAKALPARRREIPATDGRTFHPEGSARPLVAFAPNAEKIVAYAPNEYDPFKRLDREIDKAFRKPHPFSKSVLDANEMKAIKLRFNIPERLKICLDRWVRKEVMHAFGHAGKPTSNIRRVTELSKIKC